MSKLHSQKRFNKKFKQQFIVVAVVVFLIISGVTYLIFSNLNSSNVTTHDEELVIKFLELGNGSTGDCIYIKYGEVDILVDAGSTTTSISSISAYLENYISDNVLEYVIVTHSHLDHIACFAGTSSPNSSLFDIYDCKFIIDFPNTDKDNPAPNSAYGRYLAKRDAEIENGAIHYTALQCYNQTDGANRVIDLGGATLEILYNYYYDHHSPGGNENNYSVCFMLSHNNKNFLFTGDLEQEGELKLIEHYPNLPKVTLFKAGHHGSYTANSLAFLNKIRPEICVVTCVAGSVEYSQNLANTFPAQAFIDRISLYTDKIYITTLGKIEYNLIEQKYKNIGFDSMNGDITVISKINGVEISGSNNSIKLKDTAWFAECRVMPPAWQD